MQFTARIRDGFPQVIEGTCDSLRQFLRFRSRHGTAAMPIEQLGAYHMFELCHMMAHRSMGQTHGLAGGEKAP